MIVLDTNIISELMKPEPDEAIAIWLKSLSEPRLATTAITIAEIAFGLHRLPDGSRRKNLQDRFLQLATAMAVLPFDQDTAFLAGACRAERLTRGLSSSASDMMIAGIVKFHNASLATRNVKDFSSLSIDLINPWNF